MHSKTPKSLLETSEGCPSPFTRLAEGRRDPALNSLSISARRLPPVNGSRLSASPPDSPHERRDQPPQEMFRRERRREYLKPARKQRGTSGLARTIPGRK